MKKNKNLLKFFCVLLCIWAIIPLAVSIAEANHEHNHDSHNECSVCLSIDKALDSLKNANLCLIFFVLTIKINFVIKNLFCTEKRKLNYTLISLKVKLTN